MMKREETGQFGNLMLNRKFVSLLFHSFIITDTRFSFCYGGEAVWMAIMIVKVNGLETEREFFLNTLIV